MDKVKYGIKNVHFCKLTYDEDKSEYSYGTIHKWPGCTAMSLPPSGTNQEIYADDIKYYVIDSNQGYSGNLDFYTLPEEFETEILGIIKNKDNVLIESAEKISSEFVLFGEFQGSESPKRFILYRVKATRPDFGGKTKEESATPETISVDIQAMPRENDHIVKATVRQTDNAVKFKDWFGSVYEPDLTPAEGGGEASSGNGETSETGTGT